MGGRLRHEAVVAGVVLSLCSLTACSGEPDVPGDRLDPAVLTRKIDKQLSITTNHENLRALLVLEGGKPAFEKYQGTDAGRYWSVGQITQVVVTSLIGIAVHEGRIPGVDATLEDLLPNRRDDMTPDERATTLTQLLTMTSGLPGTDRDQIWSHAVEKDPVGAILRGADRRLLRAFEFSNHSAHLLAAILVQATGGSVLDCARSRLFDPLGIDTRPADERVVRPGKLAGYVRADFAWPVDTSGVNYGWSLLEVVPSRDLVVVTSSRVSEDQTDAGEPADLTFPGRPRDHPCGRSVTISRCR